MTKERKYIAYWDCLGFETICDITSYERQRLIADLKNTTVNPPINYHALMLRARYNPQRSPEIWIFTATDDIREDDLKQIAIDSPQYLADLIREKGTCVFSTPKTEQVIV